MGRDRKSNSRDVSNRSLKTDRDTESRAYIGTYIRKTSLKTDGETEKVDPT